MIITGTIQNHIMCKKCITKKSFQCPCGVGQLIGTVFYEGTLTTTKYIELILNGVVTDVLEMTLLSLVKSMHLQQDGMQAHKSYKCDKLVQPKL